MPEASCEGLRLDELSQPAITQHHAHSNCVACRDVHNRWACTNRMHQSTAVHRDLSQAVWCSTAPLRFSSAVYACSESGGLLGAMACCEVQHRFMSKQYETMCISQQDFTALQPAPPVILHCSAHATEIHSTQLVLFEAGSPASQAHMSCFLACVQHTAPLLLFALYNVCFAHLAPLRETCFCCALAVSALTLHWQSIQPVSTFHNALFVHT